MLLEPKRLRISANQSYVIVDEKEMRNEEIVRYLEYINNVILPRSFGSSSCGHGETGCTKCKS